MKVWVKVFLVLAMMFSAIVVPASAAETTKKLSVKLTFSPAKKTYDLGEKIRIEASSSKKSDQFTAKLFINDVDESGSLTHETVKKNLVSSSSFTPAKAGTYKIRYEISTVDDKGKTWAGKIEKQIKVEGAPISVSLSPVTASMKLGDDLYILVKYPVTQINTEEDVDIELSQEDDVEEIPLGFTEKDGYYQKLYKFTPKKSGSHKFTVSVNNVTRVGEATASISVKK